MSHYRKTAAPRNGSYLRKNPAGACLFFFTIEDTRVQYSAWQGHKHGFVLPYVFIGSPKKIKWRRPLSDEQAGHFEYYNKTKVLNTLVVRYVLVP